MYQRNVADELLVKFAIFSEISNLLFTKQNGVLSNICREFSEVTSQDTVRMQSDAAECQIPSPSRFAHKVCKLDENNKIELEKYLFPVSCVTSQLGTRPWMWFWKIIGKSDFVNFERKYLGK